MSVQHYENFPVASILLPARLRPAVEAVYAFARSADDLADEGQASPAERLAALDVYARELDRLERNEPSSLPLFARLAPFVGPGKLPLPALRDLLSAFRQDVVTTRYADFPALLDYCRRSANPVGHLMLHLYGEASPQHLERADAICTALQLINFWQDVALDWQKGRIYLPQDEMACHGVSENDIAAGRCGPAWHSLMAFQAGRARAMMLAGAPLALQLPGRVGWELRLVVQGGLRILDRLQAADYDVFRHRPQLGKADWLAMGWKALRMKPAGRQAQPAAPA